MQCRICGCDVVAASAVACGRCSVPFHRECWEYNQGCGIYGCGGTTPQPWVEPAAGAVVAIDLSTRPPFRLAPVAEALVRRLPGWGRAFLPPVLLGAVGGALTVWLAQTFSTAPSHASFTGLLVGAGALAGLLSAALGPAIRRRPLAASALVGAAYACLLWYFRYREFGRTGSARWFVSGLLFFAGMAVAAGCFAEAVAWVTGLGARLGRAWAVALRAVLTSLFVVLIVLAFDWIAGAGSIRWSEAGVISVLGLCVVAPPFELSKSALLHRLKAEAAERDA